MENKILIKINVKGGILSIGDLDYMVNSIKKYGVQELCIGERQNLYFTAHGRTRDALEKLLRTRDFEFEIDAESFPNIVSSYAAEDIFSGSTWLSEGIYQDILNSLTFNQQVKINIVDNKQGFAPLFTGHLNFISSSHLNFWYLYINHPAVKGFQRWPVLVYSTEIGRLSKVLDTALTTEKEVDLKNLIHKINIEMKLMVADITDEASIPITRFPNYEGLNKIGDKYWLGIYRRQNCFSMDFLEALCEICLETKVGKLCLTTWKSLIIKGIPEEMKQSWEKFLGFQGINTRHSSIELNWQLPDFDKSALKLKKYLVNQFNKADLQTNGLAFTLKTRPMDLAGSIVIERKGRLNIGSHSFLPVYNILFAEDFNPNALKWEVYAVDIRKRDLPYYLMLLCRNYYEQLGKKTTKNFHIASEDEAGINKEKTYQCMDCLTLYQEKFGDEVNNILPNTSFENLPDGYNCPVCESPKSRYQERSLKKASKSEVVVLEK
ncbi:MAG TPA: rubredoxin [Cytophagales bacterium]|nr:rubredoxin [Cytophagales bacterium]